MLRTCQAAICQVFKWNCSSNSEKHRERSFVESWKAACFRIGDVLELGDSLLNVSVLFQFGAQLSYILTMLSSYSGRQFLITLTHVFLFFVLHFIIGSVSKKY